MKKEEIIDLLGNVLVGIVCPFLFLISNEPLKKKKNDEDIQNIGVDN